MINNLIFLISKSVWFNIDFYITSFLSCLCLFYLSFAFLWSNHKGFCIVWTLNLQLKVLAFQRLIHVGVLHPSRWCSGLGSPKIVRYSQSRDWLLRWYALVIRQGTCQFWCPKCGLCDHCFPIATNHQQQCRLLWLFCKLPSRGPSSCVPQISSLCLSLGRSIWWRGLNQPSRVCSR